MNQLVETTFFFCHACGLLAGYLSPISCVFLAHPEEQFPVSLLKHPLLRLGNGGAVRGTQSDLEDGGLPLRVDSE